MNNWDAHFLDEALLAARLSKDPSTKVGAVIVDQNRRIVSKGYNGFPRGVSDDPAYYEDRGEKLLRGLHAEANAILFAQRDLTGCTLYSSFVMCSQCAAMAIQTGISRIVYIQPNGAIPVTWQESFDCAWRMCSEASVLLEAIEHQGGDDG